MAPTRTSRRNAAGAIVAISAAIQPPKPRPSSETPVSPRSASSDWYITATSRTFRSQSGRSEPSYPGCEGR